ncbi:hypothetical protein F5Y17DRAFT_464574 [Xylariaceae sp. FL0594]|nr:hypothetical protein F5Y17DRAFT_464574 [Xylariaceae sp. FL0594]
MVYCGKPSRGCQMCRTRRIKCDEAKPTCNQCAKSRRQCPGYKDEFDLVFRNETKSTERRAKKANKKAAAQRAAPQDSQGWAVTRVPSLSIEEQAECHFISHFVLMPDEGHTVGHLDFLPPILDSLDPDSHVHHAFKACALSFLNNRGAMNQRLLQSALNEYTLALAQTNAALREPETQLSDATLTAVILLGMFESISAKQIGMASWGSHVDGAVQLVRARGKKQVKTKTGLQLFIAVRTLMTVYCLTAAKAPAMDAGWWLEDTVFSKTAVAVQRLMIKTTEIRALVTETLAHLRRTPENTELVLDAIRRAQALDQETVAWQHGVPESWLYRTVAWEDNVQNGDYSKAEVFPGRVDVYNDIWIASVTNSARAVRLILQALIMRCAAWVCWPVDYRTTPEYATAASVCRDEITDIIASVPYNLGWHLKKKKEKRDCGKTNFGTFACGQEDSPKGLAGYLVTWHLTCVNSQDFATDAQRAWVVGRLRSIGNDLGIRYANVMTQLHMRVPSMLIRRDALISSSYGFESLFSQTTPPPEPGQPLSPIQQWEAVQKQKMAAGKAELIRKLTQDTNSEVAHQYAEKWLNIRPTDLAMASPK